MPRIRVRVLDAQGNEARQRTFNAATFGQVRHDAEVWGEIQATRLKPVGSYKTDVLEPPRLV